MNYDKDTGGGRVVKKVPMNEVVDMFNINGGCDQFQQVPPTCTMVQYTDDEECTDREETSLVRVESIMDSTSTNPMMDLVFTIDTNTANEQQLCTKCRFPDGTVMTDGPFYAGITGEEPVDPVDGGDGEDDVKPVLPPIEMPTLEGYTWV